MIELRFSGCIVRVFDSTHYLETVFPDGARVPAAPEDTDSYRATAARLGYGADTWALCRDHEISHTRLAEMLGLPYSPTLWAVAHGHSGGIPGSPFEMMLEEDLVLAYQRRYHSGKGVSVAAGRFAKTGAAIHILNRRPTDV